MKIDRENLSYGNVIRRQFRIYLEEETSPADSRYREIAEEIVSKETQPFQALSFLFYDRGTDPLEELADVVVDYAPGGNWNQAATKPAGDYSDHKYRVQRIGG